VAEIIPPRRDEPLVEVDGRPTLRTSEYLERMSSQTNTITTEIISSSDNIAIALIFSLENRIGSGDFLTSDETGFTTDSTKLTVDQTEA